MLFIFCSSNSGKDCEILGVLKQCNCLVCAYLCVLGREREREMGESEMRDGGT